MKRANITPVTTLSKGKFSALMLTKSELKLRHLFSKHFTETLSKHSGINECFSASLTPFSQPQNNSIRLFQIIIRDFWKNCQSLWWFPIKMSPKLFPPRIKGLRLFSQWNGFPRLEKLLETSFHYLSGCQYVFFVPATQIDVRILWKLVEPVVTHENTFYWHREWNVPPAGLILS